MKITLRNEEENLQREHTNKTKQSEPKLNFFFFWMKIFWLYLTMQNMHIHSEYAKTAENGVEIGVSRNSHKL